MTFIESPSALKSRHSPDNGTGVLSLCLDLIQGSLLKAVEDGLLHVDESAQRLLKACFPTGVIRIPFPVDYTVSAAETLELSVFPYSRAMAYIAQTGQYWRIGQPWLLPYLVGAGKFYGLTEGRIVAASMKPRQIRPGRRKSDPEP